MDWKAKVELFEQLHREHEFGIGTVAGVAPIASHSEACSFACSRTMRTARSRTSGKYRTDIFCFSIAPSSQGLEPLANPARFK